MQKVYLVAKYKVPEVENNATISECVEFISTLSILGIDIETSRKFKEGTYVEKTYRGGLDPYLTRVVMIQLGNIDVQYVIDVRDFTKEELSPILDYLNYNPNLVLVGHNLKFEAKHLKHTYGINFHTIYDTMIGELCLYNGITTGLSLADLAAKYLGVKKKREVELFESNFNKSTVTLDEDLIQDAEHVLTPFEVEENFQIDKSTRLQFITIGDKPFSKTQVMYGADDIIFPILIRERQLVGRVLSDGTIHLPLNWIKIEMHYCLVLADMELNGMSIDTKMWEDLHAKNEIVYKERERKITKWIIENYPQYSSGTYDLFTNEITCHIKWTSSKQVVKLFKDLNICPRAYSKQTKRVEDTVGAVELLRKLPNNLKVAYRKNKDMDIVDLDTFIYNFLLFKKAEQSVTTFGKAWLKYVHPITGRCHSSYRQILNTTRISSTNPNLNNISGGAWRDCFSVPEGKILVNLDFSAQEVRQLAAVCKDEFLMDFFIRGDDFFGDDFHAFTATKVYKLLTNNPDLVVPPKEIKDENGKVIDNPAFTSEHGGMRTNSKEYTFGMAYGKSAYTFSMDLGITLDEAEALMDSYFVVYPGLRTHFKKCEELSNSKDYIVIDEYTRALWSCPFYGEIESLFREAWSHFPEDYKSLSKKDRESAKRILYEEKPFVKTLFQQAGRLRASLEKKFRNFPIQGACAQMLKIAMNIFRKQCIEGGHDFKIVGNIYDEVLCEVDEDKGHVAGKMLKAAMERGGTIISPKVPQVANYVLSKVWEH